MRIDGKKGNYSGMLIGRSIAILYFLARKITAEGAEERRAFNRLSHIPQVAIHFPQFLLIAVLNVLKILFLYCGGATYPIPTEGALHVYMKNMYFNR